MLPGNEFLRCSDLNIPIIGDVTTSAARPFAQVSLGVGPQAKGDATKKKLFTRGFRFLMRTDAFTGAVKLEPVPARTGAGSSFPATD
jgi:hypothetical protein